MGTANIDHVHCFCSQTTGGRPTCCKCGLSRPEPAPVINHKGEMCWVRPWVLCQEGYCQDCMIYLEKPEATNGNTQKVCPSKL